MFSDPVKYVMNSGEIAYINNKLVRNTDKNTPYSWKNGGNVFDLYMSENAEKGILLSIGDVQITDRPVSLLSKDKSKGKTFDTTVSASEYFIKYTAPSTETYTYAPNNTGYSVRIEFDSVPKNDYVSIQLESPNLTSVNVKSDGSVELKNPNSLISIIKASGFTDEEGIPLDIKINTSVNPIDVKRGIYHVIFSFNSTYFANDINYPITLTYDNNIVDNLIIEENEAKIANKINNTATVSSNVSTASADPENNLTTNRVIYDAEVYQGNPNYNYGDEETFDVGYYSGYNESRVYVKFDLSNLPIRYDQVVSACFSIYQCRYYPIDQRFDLEIYKVNSNWNETGITWINKPSYEPQRLALSSIMVGSSWDGDRISTRWHNFMLTSTVQSWLQGLPNYGIVLKQYEGTASSGVYRRFGSSEATLSSIYRPKFVITYTPDTASTANVGIVDGKTYYIKNKGSTLPDSNCLSPLYLTAPGTANYTDVIQSPFFTSGARWKVVKSTTPGYYKLYPENAPTKALHVENNSSSSYMYMQIAPKQNIAGQDFKFIRNWDGSYHIVSRVSNDTRGLWVGNSVENAYVFQVNVDVDTSMLDDWTLEEVDNGKACAYGNSSLNGQYYIANEVKPILSDMGYTTTYGIDVGAPTILISMMTSTITYISTHGGHSCIEAPTPTHDYKITASSIQQIGSDINFPICDLSDGALSSAKLILISACEAGLDDVVDNTHVSLADQLYRKGAHCVITYSDFCATNFWDLTFLSYLVGGSTIDEAMRLADEYILLNGTNPDHGNALNRHVLGDTAMRLDR